MPHDEFAIRELQYFIGECYKKNRWSGVRNLFGWRERRGDGGGDKAENE
jgi:hypothetical protein